MHGIWTLVFVPLAAVIAWRYSGPKVRLAATWLMTLFGIGLAGWFGYLTFEGTEFANSIYDRVMHSLGVVVGSINVPIVQLISAAAIVVCWPRQFEFANITAAEDKNS